MAQTTAVHLPLLLVGDVLQLSFELERLLDGMGAAERPPSTPPGQRGIAGDDVSPSSTSGRTRRSAASRISTAADHLDTELTALETAAGA
jgi:hypothetical protein